MADAQLAAFEARAAAAETEIARLKALLAAGPSTSPAAAGAAVAVAATEAAAAPSAEEAKGQALLEEVTAQGSKVRTLKSQKAPKEEVEAAVKTLLDLKAKYRDLTGKDAVAIVKKAPKSVRHTHQPVTAHRPPCGGIPPPPFGAPRHPAVLLASLTPLLLLLTIPRPRQRVPRRRAQTKSSS